MDTLNKYTNGCRIKKVAFLIDGVFDNVVFDTLYRNVFGFILGPTRVSHRNARSSCILHCGYQCSFVLLAIRYRYRAAQPSRVANNVSAYLYDGHRSRPWQSVRFPRGTYYRLKTRVTSPSCTTRLLKLFPWKAKRTPPCVTARS